MFSETTATRRVCGMKKRLRGVCGGTSASKTISILLYLIAMAQTDKKPTLTSVVSETVPHLKKGSMRDFLSILEQHGYYRDDNWNKTDYIYTFETGSKIEFFSADQPDKVRGPRRDRLFLNEANNVNYLAFEQLEVRTKDLIFCDWNPTSEFWWYTEVKPNRTDWEEITLTYKQNEALDPQIVASIEQRKNNTNWWTVYGLGQIGVTAARIYKDWALIDAIPHEAKLERYGLDFGYTNDPTAIIGLYRYNGGYILDEICYQTGLSNRAIADIFNNLTDKALIIADSAEPKSIDEIRLHKLNILPAKKGPGSKNQGIQFVQDQRISVTNRSLNLIKEYRNYMWMTDKDGKIINEAQGNDDALDAARYAFERAQMVVRASPAPLMKDPLVKQHFLAKQGRGNLSSRL